MAGIRLARLAPVFNAVADTDYGPSTPRPIRYSIASFKTILKRFLEEYVPDTGTWDGPLAVDVSLYADATYTGGTHYTASAVPAAPYDAFKFSAGAGISQATGNTFHVDDFFDPFNPVEGGACPLLPEGEGEQGEREGADLVEFAGGLFGCLLDLFSPAIPQSGWDTVTHVWLPFSLAYPTTNMHSYSYLCDGGVVSGGTTGGPFIDLNILGIDYAAGWTGGGPSSTGSIALGDGTTKLFLWSPTGNRFELDALDTNNF